MADFRMPSLGADMDEGKLVEWLIKPGDYVHRGDVVAVVDTTKTLMDVETFEEGVVSELLVDIGTTVPVGTALARITQTPAAGAAMPPGAMPPKPSAAAAPKPAAAAAAPKPPAEAAAPKAAEAVPAPPAAHEGPVSPPVRHLAHRLGIDTAGLRGTGKAGAVTRADVEQAARKLSAPQHAPRSSPRARRLAAELGVDLGTVSGTGPQGAVVEADIRAAVAQAPGQPQAPAQLWAQAPGQPKAPAAAARAAPEAVEPPARAAGEKRRHRLAAAPEALERVAGLRRAIGSLMSRSKKTIPHYYLSTTVDLSTAIAWMEAENEHRPVASRLVPAALLLKASARAARDVPEVNGFYNDGTFQPSAAVHLGVAVSLRQGGLVAPAIHDADTLSLDELMEQLRDLVARARAGRLQRAEMADPTITVTNLGDLGAESVYGVIYPPQVAMVGFGRVVEQPYASHGMLGVRPAVTATLSADHRVSDGLRGGRFLAGLEELLQKPEEL